MSRATTCPVQLLAAALAERKAAGFAEHAFDSPGPNQWSVGMNRFAGEPTPLRSARASSPSFPETWNRH